MAAEERKKRFSAGIENRCRAENQQKFRDQDIEKRSVHAFWLFRADVLPHHGQRRGGKANVIGGDHLLVLLACGASRNEIRTVRIDAGKPEVLEECKEIIDKFYL